MQYAGLIHSLITSVFMLIYPLLLGTWLLKGIEKVFYRPLRLWERLPLAYFLGAILIVVSFYWGELYQLSLGAQDFIFYFYMALGVLGLAHLSEDLKAINWRASWGWSTLAVLLVVGVTQYVEGWHFYSFPARNLFADVHFLKGAIEFSETGILNLYTADSYWPFRQIMMGLLHRYFHLDLVVAYWFTPIWYFGLSFCIAMCLLSALGIQKNRMIMAIFLALLPIGYMHMSNNAVVTLFALWLLAFFIRELGDSDSVLKILSALFVAVIAACFVSLKTWKASPEIWAFLALLGSLLFVLSGKFSRNAFVLFLVLSLVFLMSPFHRASFGAFPFVSILAGLWVMLKNLDSNQLRKLSLIGMGVFSIVSLILASAILIYWRDLPMGLCLPSQKLTLLIFKTNPFEHYSSCFSFFANGLLEIFRGYSFLSGILFLVFVFSPGSWQDRAASQRLAMGSLAFSILGVGTLMGLPYFYRMLMFSGVLLAIPLAEQILQRKNIFEKGQWAYMGYLALLAVVIYFLGGQFTFLADFLPAFLLSLAAVFLVSQKKMAASVLLVFLLGFYAERQTQRVGTFLWVGHSVGAPLSHYSKAQYQAAKTLSEHPSGKIILSDPISTSLTQALTGYNSLYLFQNIDTMRTEDAEAARSLLRGIIENPAEAELSLTSYLEKNPHSISASQYFLKRTGVEFSPKEILSRLIIVVTPRTLGWMRGEEISFFPPQKPIASDSLSGLEKNFEAHVAERQYFAGSLKFGIGR